jgi:hypothetical protein
MNSVDPFATSFLYTKFPEYYRWDKMEKNGFKESKERRLVGWCMRALQKEKVITYASF